MIINRVWAMPSRWTFQVKPIASLLAEELQDGERWVDPTAGETSPASDRNDVREDSQADTHTDALSYLRDLPSATFDGCLFDPPYSLEQARRRYSGTDRLYPGGTAYFEQYWSRVMDELGRVVRPGGKAIRCGWSSGGLGKKRGFELQRVLLVAHGAAHPHDTIITVERKVQGHMALGKTP